MQGVREKAQNKTKHFMCVSLDMETVEEKIHCQDSRATSYEEMPFLESVGGGSEWFGGRCKKLKSVMWVPGVS